MLPHRKFSPFCFALFLIFISTMHAFAAGESFTMMPQTTFVEFQSVDLEASPPAPLTIKGKLKIPVHLNSLFYPEKLAAVVILHGSSGIDFRGDFYARALNLAGIATLEIDMWEARGIENAADRPPVPLYNYPDAFAALKFLSEQPEIDPERIGVMGFSWGGVVTMASATKKYASQFGGELRFKAHVAHYPVCFAYNSPIPGTEFTDLTGAPILIQIGAEDDYDDGPAPCHALKDALPEAFRETVEIAVYDDTYHAFDRLEVAQTVVDPFSHLGLGGEVEMKPDPDHAYKARRNAVLFFLKNLGRP